MASPKQHGCNGPYNSGLGCEAHIDDARAASEHFQAQRFVWCIPLLGHAEIRQ
jgi:hypothetical protein